MGSSGGNQLLCAYTALHATKPFVTLKLTKQEACEASKARYQPQHDRVVRWSALQPSAHVHVEEGDFRASKVPSQGQQLVAGWQGAKTRVVKKAGS